MLGTSMGGVCVCVYVLVFLVFSVFDFLPRKCSKKERSFDLVKIMWLVLGLVACLLCFSPVFDV